MQLRSYQTKAINDLRDSFNKKGKKSPLLVMPTGAGKTVVFAEISKSLAQNNKNVLILVHRKELIDQASKKLQAIKVNHGIIAAKYKPKKSNIQIASVQTLVRRLEKKLFEPSWIIIDEAHHAAAGSWQKIISTFSNAYKIGCTATPIRLDGKGLADFFDDIVPGPSIQKLTQDKYLAPYRVFAPPLKLDLDKVKTVAGDYQKKHLEKEIDKIDIIGDAVTQYKKHAHGLPAIAFCISVKHATDVCNKFKDAGYKSAIVHGEMSMEDRNDAIQGLANGKVEILTSVDVISEGTDVPDVSAAILLRPTKSEGLYLQQVGRILRPKEGKTAIILDHVNSTRTHGFVDDIREWSLNSKKKKNKNNQQALTVETCKKCFASYKPQPTCPVCGYQAQNRERYIKQEEGELEELKRKEKQETEKQQQRILISSARTMEELEMVAKMLGYKKGWAYRVFESRKNKTIKIPKNKSHMSIRDKELVSKLVYLNFVGFKMLKEFHDNKKVDINNLSEQDINIIKNIFSTFHINSSKSFNHNRTYRKCFFNMCKYYWDRSFIINYVASIKRNKIHVNPNEIINNCPRSIFYT